MPSKQSGILSVLGKGSAFDGLAGLAGLIGSIGLVDWSLDGIEKKLEAMDDWRSLYGGSRYSLFVAQSAFFVTFQYLQRDCRLSFEQSDNIKERPLFDGACVMPRTRFID